jgi:hypothetical protein
VDVASYGFVKTEKIIWWYEDLFIGKWVFNDNAKGRLSVMTSVLFSATFSCFFWIRAKLKGARFHLSF